MTRRRFGELCAQVAIGTWATGIGGGAKPLCNAFFKLVATIFAPISFDTAVLGIARIGSFKASRCIGERALIHGEMLSALAMAIDQVATVAPRRAIGARARAAR